MPIYGMLFMHEAIHGMACMHEVIKRTDSHILWHVWYVWYVWCCMVCMHKAIKRTY